MKHVTNKENNQISTWQFGGMFVEEIIAEIVFFFEGNCCPKGDILGVGEVLGVSMISTFSTEQGGALQKELQL